MRVLVTHMFSPALYSETLSAFVLLLMLETHFCSAVNVRDPLLHLYKTNEIMVL
jgi:hypothetical protein